MKRLTLDSALSLVGFVLCLVPVRAEPPYVNAADNKIFAQTLLNEVVAANPDLIVVGFHGVAPGAKISTVIASNLNRVGKKDDDDDVAAANEAKTICGPRSNDPKKYEVEMPLRDASGQVVGALSLIFKYEAEGDEAKIITRSFALRNTLAKKIPNRAALFVPTK
jgi:hypothetical protein